MSSLNLGIIGNCSFASLINKRANIQWSCMPHFEGDPVFCSLLNGQEDSNRDEETSPWGFFVIEIENFSHCEQSYIRNTAILVTTLHDTQGNSVKITDFSPRYRHYGRVFKPATICRLLEPVSGTPRIRIRLRPRFEYGSLAPDVTLGSNHIRYVSPDMTLRLSTDAPTIYVKEETVFHLSTPLTLIFGPDAPLRDKIDHTGRKYLALTKSYWNEFTRSLHLPFEWQDEVIRAAITLKLCTYEDTGAIIAAATTSIPEARGSQRNWDYRFCWLRDSYFVIHALNRLGATHSMEGYISYIMNLLSASTAEILQPVFGINLRKDLTESEVPSLNGYRGMGPVRTGNKAYEQIQNDVFGSFVLAMIQAFFDERLTHKAGLQEFYHLEDLGEKAIKFYDRADAGLWELRDKARIHTFSAIMCWAACDRLAKIAAHLELTDRASFWRQAADQMHSVICKRSWNTRLGCFMESFEADSEEYLDASLLLMHQLGFIDPKDPRFIATVDAVGKRLKHKGLLYRYILEDDFGQPETAFTICSFWYIDALHAIGREDEAREMFAHLLSKRNHLGLLSEDLDFDTGELWGNFPQTYSMVGLINSAMRLSRKWEDAL